MKKRFSSSASEQPSYFCIANLGDVNPFEHGGEFVCIDRRGIYDPILLIYDQDFRERREITLERCHKIINEENHLHVGTNIYHPFSTEWFSSDLAGVASFFDCHFEDLVNMLCSNSVLRRANAYLMLCEYYGVSNFDEYPLKYENDDDAKLFCDKMLEQIEEAKHYHDGYFARNT